MLRVACVADDVPASMEPPLFTADNSLYVPYTSDKTPSFNGAAVIHGG